MVTDHIFQRGRNGHCVGVAGDRIRLRSVCVIGAGAAGLCSLRHFTSRPDQFGSVVCYEQSDKVGGTWNYSESTGKDRNGMPVHSSMYRDLHTNLPIQIMEFPDFKSNCTESYVHHTEVCQYLHDYSLHYNLNQYIRFEHSLKHVTRDHTKNCWTVSVHSITQNRTYTEQYDILILGPGRHSVPFWPQIKTMNQFTGSIIHSHDYRCREPYTGQRVAVIGGGPSGIDICLEICKVADDVIFINRTKHFQPLPNNVHQINATLHGFKQKSVMIKSADSERMVELKIDSVIMATGYRFNLAYLDPDNCGLHWNGDDTIDGLYRHMINIRFPSMVLLGVCQRSVLPFPLYHQQILYYLKVQLGELQLPPQDKMYSEVHRELQLRKALGFRERDRHCLNVESLIDYLKQLEREGNIAPLAPVKLSLFREIEQNIRSKNIMNYKRISYRLIDEQRYEEV